MMNFKEELQKLAIRWAQEIRENFVVSATTIFETQIKEKDKFGYHIISTQHKSDGSYFFPSFKFKFGIDDEQSGTLDPMTFQSSVIVPNKIAMEIYAKETIEALPSNLLSLVCQLKLDGVWGVIMPEIITPDFDFVQHFFAGPIVRDECATEGGGSVDFVWYVPRMNLFYHSGSKPSFPSTRTGMIW
jgi:hypothetical protein